MTIFKPSGKISSQESPRMNAPDRLAMSATDSSSEANTELLARFRTVRQHTLVLVAPFSPEDCQLQSMPDASPAKWHLAHTTWFFETMVLEAAEPHFAPFDARFRMLFNSYYHGVGAAHARDERGLISRPTLVEVMRYRAQVDERMQRLLAHGSLAASVRQLVALGLQHEQQHQELLLTDMQHALSRHPQWLAGQPPAEAVPQTPLNWLPYAGGLVEQGWHPERDGDFCFDHETPRHQVWLAPFEMGQRLVTQLEFWQFMSSGGYQRPEWWLSLGWEWRKQGAVTAPLYWRQVAGDGLALEDWRQFTLSGELPIEPHAPMRHLSYFEADACARWAGARLPTETEWELAARSGQLHQAHGQCWQWTSSAFSPYPGYKPWAGAVGEYNGKFMCQQLVLRGSSQATPQGHARDSYRNFFPPEAQWQFTGLRLARDGGAGPAVTQS